MRTKVAFSRDATRETNPDRHLRDDLRRWRDSEDLRADAAAAGAFPRPPRQAARRPGRRAAGPRPARRRIERPARYPSAPVHVRTEGSGALVPDRRHAVDPRRPAAL